MPISKHYKGHGASVAKTMKKEYGANWKKYFYATEKKENMGYKRKSGRKNPEIENLVEGDDLGELAVKASTMTELLLDKFNDEVDIAEGSDKEDIIDDLTLANEILQGVYEYIEEILEES